MELSLPDSAQLYVETVESLLIDKSKSIKSVCDKISKIIGDVKYDKNELYECLDIISEKSSLSNLDKKVVAKLRQGALSGKNALELLNTLPAVERSKVLKVLTDPSTWGAKGAAATRVATMPAAPTNALAPNSENQNALAR
jgi:hypothetical protein